MKSRTKHRILCLYTLTILSLWKGGTSQVLPNTLTKQGELKITTSSADVLSHLYSTSNTDGSLVAFCSENFKADGTPHGSKKVNVYDVKTDEDQITPKKTSDLTSLGSPIESCGFINQERLLVKEAASTRVVKNFKVATDGTVSPNTDSTWTQNMYYGNSNDIFRYNNKNNYYLFIDVRFPTPHFGDSSTTTAPVELSQVLRFAVFSRVVDDSLIFAVERYTGFQVLDFSTNPPSTQGSFDINLDFGGTAGAQIGTAVMSQGGALNDRVIIGIPFLPKFLGYYDVAQNPPSLYGEGLAKSGVWNDNYYYSGDANILNLEGSDMFFLSGQKTLSSPPSHTPLIFVDASDVVAGTATGLTIHDVSAELLSGITTPWVSSMSTIGFGNYRYVMSGVENIEGGGSTWDAPTTGFIITFTAYFCHPTCNGCSTGGPQGCTGC